MAIHSDTRTIHTIHIDLPDDILGKMEAGDEIEVMFHTRAEGGRVPSPIKLSWAMKRWIFGENFR